MTGRAVEPAGSPLLQQYREIKSRHQSAILFFRMGDFYEMFFEDAELASRVLNITLTSRGDGVPLAGVPVKAATEYLRQLIAHGHRVAICEQVEDPRLSRGIVKREVVETLTPGSVLDESFLPGSRNNFLVALAPAGDRIGLAAVDMSTGEFTLETLERSTLEEALTRLAPAEIVVPEELETSLEGALRTVRERWEFDAELGRPELAQRFGLASLDGLGLLSEDWPAIGAAGALLRYISELQPAGLTHLARPTVRRHEGHLWLDEMTRRNLELVDPLRAGARNSTLIEALDSTVTPMGARLLRRWVLSPLRNPGEINTRLDAVEVSVQDNRGRERLREALDGVRDLERLAGRVSSGRATPRDMGALRDSFLRLPDVLAALNGISGRERSSLLSELSQRFELLADLATLLGSALSDRLPVSLADGDVIRRGYDNELDELRDLRDGGKQYIASLQQRERDRTGITSLKVGYNKVFGYYLEITNAHAARVPADYERRQTLSNAERFVTPELKEYESKVLGAEERIGIREGELFTALRSTVAAATLRIQHTAKVLSLLDVTATFADAAVRHRYVRPVIQDAFELTLTGCRHPVIERLMPRETFIPNDVHFELAARVLLVTGPNMAGKSTILRQIGLCVVMAQMGSFVPATAATIGVADRLFTRVGASDNLAQGQSTFMVEMSETSAILHNATAQSLVLLDEIGRGTSTYDGVAIAWAVTEHLHDRIGCKTMFATHYHELMQLPEKLQHARNLNVAVREHGDRVIFLHRLEPGGTDRSYGIHVAQLAGLPADVVNRAKAMLLTLEAGHRVVPGAPPASDPTQLQLFASPVPHPVMEELRTLDLDDMTPLQALNWLVEQQRKAAPQHAEET
ncbi:MAG TPA: DNA mismatch repair protein MutS [Gemmatimonadales bacterium]|jgi:DNA mismatch repair protein MutS|nr:DNA mismatch repair protein MutS [Gemmatimonadales bacterium]